MTIAVCHKCGEFKFGAWTTCKNCGQTPSTDDEIAISLALTDHHFDAKTLKEMSDDIKKSGIPPRLLPEQQAQILAQVKSTGILSRLRRTAQVDNQTPDQSH